MARISKIETCMFCGCVPCECNKKTPKARATRAVKRAEVVSSAPAPAAAPEEFVPPARRPGPFANFKHPTEQLREMQQHTYTSPLISTEEQVQSVLEDQFGETARMLEVDPYQRALRTLLDSGIVHPDDQRKLRNELRVTRNPTLDARLGAWKREHRA